MSVLLSPIYHFLSCSLQIHITNLQFAQLRFVDLRSQGIIFKSISDGRDLKVVHLLQIALKHYLVDVKKTVTAGVENLLTAVDDIDASRELKRCLGIWIRDATLFSFTYHDASFRELLTVTCGAAAQDIEKGLPPGNDGSPKISYLDIAKAIASMTKPNQPSRIGAPFFKNGKAQIFMKCALLKISETYMTDQSAFLPWITQLLARFLQIHNFKFIPWSSAGTGEKYMQ